MVAFAGPPRTVSLSIVSKRLRGTNGQWCMCHMVFDADVPGRDGYIRSFASIAVARRFVARTSRPS